MSSGASVRGSITSALDALRRELLGGGERLAEQPAERDDRDVASLAPHRRLAERDDVLALGHLAVLERQQVVVEEDDGVVVADRRPSSGPSRPRPSPAPRP